MDFAEIKIMKEQELADLLAEKRATLRQLRFQVAGGGLKNVRSIRVMKKTIAKIFTALRQKTTV